MNPYEKRNSGSEVNEFDLALEKEVTADLNDLGLSWDQLKGKKVLDIGGRS